MGGGGERPEGWCRAAGSAPPCGSPHVGPVRDLRALPATPFLMNNLVWCRATSRGSRWSSCALRLSSSEVPPLALHRARHMAPPSQTSMVRLASSAPCAGPWQRAMAARALPSPPACVHSPRCALSLTGCMCMPHAPPPHPPQPIHAQHCGMPTPTTDLTPEPCPRLTAALCRPPAEECRRKGYGS